MRPEEITLETTAGDLDAAIKRGDLTIDDWVAQAPRLRTAQVEREAGREKAIDAVKTGEARKRQRTGRWASRFILGGDGWRGYLVLCGRAGWHVTEGSLAVKRFR